MIKPSRPHFTALTACKCGEEEEEEEEEEEKEDREEEEDQEEDHDAIDSSRLLSGCSIGAIYQQA